MKTLVLIILTALFFGLAISTSAQNANHDQGMADCPMHAQHTAQDSHHAVVEKHGDEAMGFAHDKTTHHFRMLPDGGALEVTANDPNDKRDLQAIRSHLSQIAVAFAKGDFSTPVFVHDGVPPGTTTMKLLRTQIRYAYEEIPSGGRVRIQSSNEVALAAIADFLRFQITDHGTGDRLTAEGTR